MKKRRTKWDTAGERGMPWTCRWSGVVAICLVLITGGCGQSSSEVGRQLGFRQGIDSAQPRLPTLKVWLGPHELMAEVAQAPRERETGMMFRTNILENEGMLFVFPRPGQVGFWMKNVPIPLSCAYIDPDGVILELHDLEPHDEETVNSGSHRVQYVLETARGWFERQGVGTGTVVRTERGTLRETFGTGTR